MYNEKRKVFNNIQNKCKAFMFRFRSGNSLLVADSYEHTVSVLHQTGLVNAAVLNADKFREIY